MSNVRYVAGTAEQIPADDQSFDYCLLYLVWHHVADPTVAAREVARVLRPGGVVLCRTQLSDHMPDLWWLRHFPSGPAADAAMYRPLTDELAFFEAAGLQASRTHLGRRAVPRDEGGAPRAAADAHPLGAATDAR